MPLLPDDFVPAKWLANAHAQTVYGVLARRALPHRVLETGVVGGEAVLRRRLETPDGDFVDVDVRAGLEGKPVVLVLHGLEGSSASGYVRVMLRELTARGWTTVALNFRSCSGVPNRQPASYSSGDFRDALWLARRLTADGTGWLGEPPSTPLDGVAARLNKLTGPLYAAGFSLGASVLLNLLAQHGDCGIQAAVAVSTPFDLDACASNIDSGRRVASVYLRNFLPTMKAKALVKAEQFPRLLDARKVAAVRTIREYDELVTAPLYGFRDAADYYEKCSSAPQLERITVPTLLISAGDDPLAPAAHLPAGVHRMPAMHALLTRTGGHVGFLGGTVLRPDFWAERVAVRWLETNRV